MKNFEQIAETPEALGAFLSALPVADGPWDAEFRRVFCTACSAENCDGDNCPHGAARNNPLWWLTQAAEVEREPEQQADGQENAVPEWKSGTARGQSSTKSAEAAWKVMQTLGYVNERPFQETQIFLRKASEILKILEQSGINPEYWGGVIGMAAAFDIHMRG